MGFSNFHFSHPIYRNLLPNIRVECCRTAEKINEDKIIKEILEGYILPHEDKEKFLKNWLGK